MESIKFWSFTKQSSSLCLTVKKGKGTKLHAFLYQTYLEIEYGDYWRMAEIEDTRECQDLKSVLIHLISTSNAN